MGNDVNGVINPVRELALLRKDLLFRRLVAFTYVMEVISALLYSWLLYGSPIYNFSVYIGAGRFYRGGR